jgi:hypothetical protein
MEIIMSNTQPLKTFRLGNISVAVWMRRKKNGERFLVVSCPSRSYRQGDTWKRSYDLATDEIRTGIELLRQAEAYMKQEEVNLHSITS